MSAADTDFRFMALNDLINGLQSGKISVQATPVNQYEKMVTYHNNFYLQSLLKQSLSFYAIAMEKSKAWQLTRNTIYNGLTFLESPSLSKMFRSLKRRL